MNELDEYERKLNGDDEAERIYAAEDIGYANRVEGVPILLARLPVESSRAVREALFGALQSIEDDAVIQGAIGLLGSEDPFVRNQAVDLLRSRGPGVIPFLQQSFSTVGKNQRKMIVDVLVAVDGPGSGEIYGLALADADVNVVITAVESLGNAGKTEFRERVEELAASGNPMLEGACLEALAQIGTVDSLTAFRRRADAGSPIAEFLLPSYCKMLGAQGDEHCLAEAADMLGSCDPQLQAPILNALTMLRQRYPSALLPQSLVHPLQGIVQNSGPKLGHQATGLLGGLTRFDGVACFLSENKKIEEDFVVSQRDSGV